jgi:hypothetical protein
MWLVWRGGVSVHVSASSGSHCDVLFPSGGFGHGRSSAGRLLVHPSSRLFNRSPGQYPSVRRANLRVAELPAARRGLFARGGGGFSHRALGGASLCLCRQRRGPGSGQWPGRRAASGRFHRTARVGRVQLIGFALSRGGSGSLLGDRSPPPRQGRVGAHWTCQWVVSSTL